MDHFHLMPEPEKITISEEELKDVHQRLEALEQENPKRTTPKKRVAVSDEECGNCHFLYGNECHRFPPVTGAGEWPAVSSRDWCGEWRAE